jgi:hypothetical protein
MKTIALETDMITRFTGRQARGTRVPLETDRPARAWLPVPPTKVRPAESTQRNPRLNPSSNIWIQLEGESLGERLMVGSLVAAAAVGVAYGFSMFLGMVENWSAFNGWVTWLMQ